MSRKAKKMIVSYQKHFDNSGTCYKKQSKKDYKKGIQKNGGKKWALEM